MNGPAVQLAPSILSADFARLGDQVAEAERARMVSDPDLVDGGIDAMTAPLVVRAGGTVLVAGSSVFGDRDRDGVAAAMKRLRAAVNHKEQGTEVAEESALQRSHRCSSG
jgi:pentose-5-phosphate-3-epimerase